MKKRNRFEHSPVSFIVYSFFILSCISLTASAAFASADEKVTKIQKTYEGIRDISGSFVQKSYIKDLKQTETFRGLFFIKRPMKMKWSYKGDQAQEVLINDDEIIIYQKKEKQAYRSKFDRDTYGQAPIALLSGFGKIGEEFFVSEKKGKLLLKPKKPMGNIISIEVEPSGGEFPIRSFTITDSLSNKVDLTLKDVKVNTGLEDKFFEFSLPKDVTIYKYNP